MGLVLSIWSSAQSLEDHWMFDVAVGKGFANGKMAEKQAGYLTYQGSWSMNLAFTKYSSEGQLGKHDLFGYQFGWQFHSNRLDESVLMNLTPEPNRVEVDKGSQLLHGPVFRLEYTRAGQFAPYFGLGAHLLAVRASTFTLHYLPQSNFYQTATYKTSGWGRINASFSAYTGFHVVMPGNWTLGLNYELYLRDAWTSKYTVVADPAALDQQEVETTYLITHTGWVHHAELRVQFPLR